MFKLGHHSTVGFSFVAAITCLCLALYIPLLWTIRPKIVPITSFTRADLVSVVRPWTTTAILEPTTVCPETEGAATGLSAADDHRNGTLAPNAPPTLFLLAIVCSAVQNFEQRQAIRDTWGSAKSFRTAPMAGESMSQTKYDHQEVRVVFLVGLPSPHDNASLQEALAQESLQHDDILQEDFVDTYTNLTVKTVMMLKWIVGSACGRRQAKYVLKVDDDTFVNIPRLLEHLIENGQTDLLMGCVIHSARVVRNIYDKFYVDPAWTPQTHYPDYLSGSGYVMYGNLPERLLGAILHDVPFFFLEDVFLTGMCAAHLGLQLVHDDGFSYEKRPMSPCVLREVVTAHRIASDVMRLVWQAMHDNGDHKAGGPTHLRIWDKSGHDCRERTLAARIVNLIKPLLF